MDRALQFSIVALFVLMGWTLTGAPASAAMSDSQARAYCTKKYGYLPGSRRQEAIDRCVRVATGR